MTRSNYYRLILVDDCSPNSSYIAEVRANAEKNAMKTRQENIVMTIRNESQRGYAGACKVGYENGESPYVCFLNSDCRIEDSRWLRNMGETLLNLKPQGVRMVSPVMNNPVGGDPAQKGEKSIEDRESVIVPEGSFLSLPCWMVHRELFPRVGGFLKEYAFGFYEDEEFAARLKSHGYKQAVCRNAYVYHEGESTIRNLWRARPDTRTIMEEENRNRCIEDMKSLK